MINGLRPYPGMKPTGLPWLGDVPKHWEIKKLGHVGRFFKGRGGTKDDVIPSGIPCVRYGDLYTTHTFFIRKARTFLSAERANVYTPIQYGDVLFAASGETIDEIGKSAVNLIEGEALCGGDTIILRPDADLHPPFLGYATDCRPAAIQKAMAGRGTTVKHIYPDELKQIRLVLAPLDEQRLIVRFLDWHGAQTAKLVRAKKKLIALLNEQKHAVIHRAVTRGLDPNVKLKPSGIPWLGNIPEHWEVRKLGSLFKSHGSGTTPSGNAYYDGGIPWVMTGDLKDGHVDTTKRTVTQRAVEEVTALRVYSAGSLIVAMYGATIGKTGVLLMDACTNQACCVLASPKPISNVEYLQMFVNFARQALIEQSYGGGQPNINAEIVKALRVPLPPIGEQCDILTVVNSGVERVAIDAALREIALIHEFRTRLIADVVTGKLDVRAAAASLPEIAAFEPIDEPPEEEDLNEAVVDDETEDAAA